MIENYNELVNKNNETIAQKIYDEGIIKFEWKKSLRNEFGMYGLLYAPNADKDGKGVWFISKSNLLNYKPLTNDKWINIIETNRIIEIYLHGERPDEKDAYDRIVFALDKINNSKKYSYKGTFKINLKEGKAFSTTMELIKEYDLYEYKQIITFLKDLNETNYFVRIYEWL